MPRLPKTEKLKEMESELLTLYGALMTQRQIADTLHVRQTETASRWSKGLPTIRAGRLLRYRTADVAKRLYDQTIYERG